MAINFPNTPTLNETHTEVGKTWKWDGVTWNLQSSLSNYDLPIAQAAVLGGIKVGNRLTIDAVTGVLSADVQSGGGGLSDGDYGDISVTNSGATWNIDAGVVGTTELSATGTKDQTTYLRGDNTWQPISGLGSGVSDFTGATSGADGTAGLVIKPSAGDEGKYLKGDGTWATVSGGGGATYSIEALLSPGIQLLDDGNAQASNRVFFDGLNGISIARKSGTDDTIEFSASLDLNDLGDVDTSGAANGKILKYNGTSWAIADDDTSGGSGVGNLQQVTTAGNTTNLSITTAGLIADGDITIDYSSTNNNSEGAIKFKGVSTAVPLTISSKLESINSGNNWINRIKSEGIGAPLVISGGKGNYNNLGAVVVLGMDGGASTETPYLIGLDDDYGYLTELYGGGQKDFTTLGGGTQTLGYHLINSELRLKDGDSNYVGFKSSTTLSANSVWQLPTSDGADGETMITNGSKILSWKKVPVNLDDLSGVSTTGAVNGKVLKYNGTDWVAGDVSTGSSYGNSDVDAHLNKSSAGNNEVLSWTGSDYAWVAQSSGGSGVTDGDKGDITVTNTGGTWTIDNNVINNNKMANDAVGINELSATGSPSSSTYLRGDNTWAEVSGGASSLNDLSDVNTSGAANGKVLKHNGSSWVVGNDNSPTNGSFNLSGLGDVSLSGSPQDNQFLRHNGTAWVNETFTGGTGTVTSVAISGGTGITRTGGPITSSGTIDIALDANLNDLKNCSVASPSLNDVLQWNGSNWIADAIASGPAMYRVAQTDNSTTWTVPSDLKGALVIVVGGGGGSGVAMGNSGQGVACGGGGGGGATMWFYKKSELGSTVSITVGNYGANATGYSNGGNGGTTSFVHSGSGPDLYANGGNGSASCSTNSFLGQGGGGGGGTWSNYDGDSTSVMRGMDGGAGMAVSGNSSCEGGRAGWPVSPASGGSNWGRGSKGAKSNSSGSFGYGPGNPIKGICTIYQF